MTAITTPSQASMTSEAAPLMGLAHLMRKAFVGEDLMPLATQLIARASTNEHDANALLDLSTILMLQGIRDLGLATQAQALQIRRLYELPASGKMVLRVLAIMAPGDLMTNTPLPFLVENSDVALSMLYVAPDEGLPRDLPAHDVMFIAVSESDRTQPLLQRIEDDTAAMGTPVLNPPARIAHTSRTQACKVLAGAPGIVMPATARAARNSLEALSREADLTNVLPDGAFPVIVRPVGSHAGNGLEKLDSLDDLSVYLRSNADDEFFLSRFIDYSGEDGLFRKYRVVLVDGVPFAGHMGVSARWMIHYLNAGMTDSAEKRAEEEKFMRSFKEDFASRHAAALKALADRFGLDYVVIDCAETRQGELLVFEVDPGAIIHSMDPADLFPYKLPRMQEVFEAFRALLMRSRASVQ